FTAQELLEHAGGAIDCILKGEGEASVSELLEAVEHDRRSIAQVPGVVSLGGEGPPARLVENLDVLVPARDLLRHRRRYFLGTLDPCASIEFARGCPWDCSFCSAWTGSTCSSGSRRSTRRACASTASGSRSATPSRPWSSPVRSASRSRST